jgi:hypothetical protein
LLFLAQVETESTTEGQQTTFNFEDDNGNSMAVYDDEDEAEVEVEPRFTLGDEEEESD